MAAREAEGGEEYGEEEEDDEDMARGGNVSHGEDEDDEDDEEEGGYASTVPASRTISVGEAGPSVEGGEEEDGEGPYSYGSAAAEEEMEDPAAA